MTAIIAVPYAVAVLSKPIPRPKPQPRIITKAERRKSKEKLAADFRRAVWIRDAGKSRASGRALRRSGVEWEWIGEIHHVLARSTDPDKIYDPANGILLSKTEHALAEACCPGDVSKRFLDIRGPVDRGKPQTFIWRNSAGDELRRRVG